MWSFFSRTFAAWNFRPWAIRAPGVDPLTVVDFVAVSVSAGGFEAVTAYAGGFEAVEIIYEAP